MFTGIIEEIGVVKAIVKNENYVKLTISTNKLLSDASLGDSISTNGVCLTIAKLNRDSYEADVMPETVVRSNLAKLQVGDEVNLERAMAAGKRFGGHIVSGHIDGTGRLQSITNDGNAVWLSIKTNEEILRYVIEKGSIAIDGISLTVAYVDDSIFKVSIIPHTGEATTLFKKNIGSVVNLECDIVGKYVEKFVFLDRKKSKSKVNEDFLRINGFI